MRYIVAGTSTHIDEYDALFAKAGNAYREVLVADDPQADDIFGTVLPAKIVTKHLEAHPKDIAAATTYFIDTAYEAAVTAL